MKEAAPGIAELAELLVAEQARVEVGVAMARIGVSQNLPSSEIWDVDGNRIGANERVVVILGQ